MPFELLEKPRNPHQTQAWKRFEEIGLPDRKSEVFGYVHFKELYSHSFQLPSSFDPLVEPREAILVFVNGAYCAHLSHIPKPFIALPLSEAFKTYGSFLNMRLPKLLQEEKDPFAALNGAYYQEALFLYLPPKSVCETSLNIVHLLGNIEKPTLMCPRIHLFAGKHASIKLSFSQTCPYADVCMNGLIDCILDEGASVALTTLSELHENAHDFLAVRAQLKSKSVFKSCSVTNGGATSRHDFVIRLQGEGSEASLQGVWALKDKRQHHVNVWMDHQAPFCTSLQKFKGILADASRSSFEGKIYVHKEAQKTSAYQMNNNLVLGERASANSKPNLEIFADDVKASHGTTMGQLDAEQLFYFHTRGIPEKEACKMLMQGFSREILEQIEEADLRNQAANIVS